MFLADLLRESHLLPAHIEDGLGELVSRGLVTADGFSGLRQLISDASRSSSSGGAIRRRPGLLRQRAALGAAGRWSMWRAVNGECRVGSAELQTRVSQSVAASNSPLPTPHSPISRPDVVEQWAWQLLRRWGVMFKDLLARESGAPSWWELLQVYRRLEARGEIRGGRFITGVAGEQFSMSESIRQLRLLRDSEPQHELILISAADPLNLVGILDDQPRVPCVASHRIVYLDGRCVGTLIADVKWFAPSLKSEIQPLVADLLDRGQSGNHSAVRNDSATTDHRATPTRLRSAAHTRTRSPQPSAKRADG
jgi:ATP-dependent Lhr-like helicase